MNENWHFSQGPIWIPTLFSQQKMWVFEGNRCSETGNSGRIHFLHFISTSMEVVTGDFLWLHFRCNCEVAQSCCVMRLVRAHGKTWLQLVFFPGILYLNLSLIFFLKKLGLL